MIDAPISAPTRVLLVGAGRRIRNNFLPALRYLAPALNVVGIQSPNPTRREPLATQWDIPAYASLDDVDFTCVDVVVVSVPTSQNAVVLRQLQSRAARLTLVIDTPIATNLRELAACSPLMNAFARVSVAEDYMNFPPFSLMRQAVSAGLVGTPRSLVLTNTGYLYHGLALIRSLVDFAPVVSSRRHVLSPTSTIVSYRVGGLSASVVGPYRQHTTGGLTLEGTAGMITEFESDRFWSKPGVPISLLRPQHLDGRLVGYEVEAGPASLAMPIPALDAMRDMDFPDKSDLNLLRGCGLMEVFRSLRDPSNFNRRYTVRDALYDSIISRLATRGRFPTDPLTVFGTNGLGAITALARVRTKFANAS